MTCGDAASDLAGALRLAWERRQSLHDDPEIDVYRIFHGVTEGCPGLDIERFGNVAVMRTVGQASDPEVICRVLLELGDFETIAVKAVQGRSGPRAPAVACLHGDTTPEQVEIDVREYGLTFRVQPLAGENSGLFLDARPARQWIRQHSSGRRVLNLFAYTGSLGVAAAAGGAAAVTHVDGKRNALERARTNHILNQLPIDDRCLFRGNIYTHLPRAIQHGQRFDAVILDPPPRLPRIKGHKPHGQDYARLAQLATDLLDEGGWLLCFFSRFDQSRDEYEAEVATAAQGKLKPWWRGTSGEDFPEQNPEAKLRLTAWVRRQAGGSDFHYD